jgi:hypothetical protein
MPTIHQHLDKSVLRVPEKIWSATAYYVPFEKEIVNFTDKLVEIARKNNSNNSVTHENDWKTIEFMYRGFKILYPQDACDFEKEMERVRKQHSLQGNHGISSEGSAMLEYMMSVPAPLYRMMRVIFPTQIWDRKFVNKFTSHFPQMKAHV